MFLWLTRSIKTGVRIVIYGVCDMKNRFLLTALSFTVVGLSQLAWAGKDCKFFSGQSIPLSESGQSEPTEFCLIGESFISLSALTPNSQAVLAFRNGYKEPTFSPRSIKVDGVVVPAITSPGRRGSTDSPLCQQLFRAKATKDFKTFQACVFSDDTMIDRMTLILGKNHPKNEPIKRAIDILFADSPAQQPSGLSSSSSTGSLP